LLNNLPSQYNLTKTNQMKKISLLLCFLPSIIFAQKTTTSKNILKTNLFGNVIGNYNLTYERAIAKKVSFSLGVRYMPKTGIPSVSKNFAEEQINDKNIRIEQFQLGNYAITPELRFYLGKGWTKGFYIAPYARYASFDLQVPMSYDFTPLGASEKAYANFSGTFTSLSGGLLLGAQFNLSKKNYS
jgi:hypothetical protein